MRHDHTDWLIHFVRDRNPEQDFPGQSEDEARYFAGGELEVDADAFQVLCTIIRLGGLLPGHSFRKDRTTIYGGEPAVCVTEMPLYAFAAYVKQAAATGRVSAYGVAFLKREFYEAGGRPAIYGLSTDKVTYDENTWIRRILSPTILPQAEQYRYVAYSPSGARWIDWSHEREWRWKVTDPERDYIWCESGDGTLGPIPGLPLFRGKSEGACFSRVCIIVWNKQEAAEVQKLLTGLHLAGSNNYDTPFDKSVIGKSRIIVLEDVINAVESGQNLDAQTIEGLEEADLVRPILLKDVTPEQEKRVKSALETAAQAGTQVAKDYVRAHPQDVGGCGRAAAVTYDIKNELVQYMLKEEFATGPYDGRVHIEVRGEWVMRQERAYHEDIYQEIAKCLSQRLGIQVRMYSWDD
jgi:hypothetical protein